MKLTINKLINEAKEFCKHESNINHEELVGITDGKAVGTYIEHKFEECLKNKYNTSIGSSARGIDLPDPEINTDIKVTSVKKPQSSSPFKNIEQKVYGLGHNLLIFVYEKTDINNKCYLDFKNCLFLEADKTGDYNLTKILREMVNSGAKEKDIIEILEEVNVPGERDTLKKLAKKILTNPPNKGYLTISNAFQWRLKYNNVINLDNEINGIYNHKNFSCENLGDYQTPRYFTDMICDYLKNDLQVNPDIIIEPTCGIGNFIKSASDIFPKKEIIGIEIDKEKLEYIDTTIPNITLINNDIFTFKFDKLNKNNTYLILGNPPWIVNTELTKSSSDNPIAMNKLNFDISESILLRLIDDFKNTKSTIAFLCKTIVSRNVFIELIENNTKYSVIKQLNINSSKIFKNDDICLFVIQFDNVNNTDKTCEVSDFTSPEKILYKFGFIDGKFYSNVEEILDLDGKCQMEWKQGVKHDCTKIMELKKINNQLKNKNNDIVSIEDTLIYPLLKMSDLKKPIVNETSKYILITQKKIKQDTSYIQYYAPKTWNYLNDNKEFFDERKSSIYNNTPSFSIFGIGEHSFKKYKVAISGFNKNPKFSLVYNDKSIMLDDACYFLSFDEYDEAYTTMLILNSTIVKKFLKNIAFLDSKRPYSKKVLKRIDISKCLNLLSLKDLQNTEKELELDSYITDEIFNRYKSKFKK